MRPTHQWCLTCEEESAIDAAGDCLWCGDPTEQLRERRRSWKRPDLRGSKYTEPQLRLLHMMHMRGASLNSLAKQTFERVGYKSHGAATHAISREWRRLGLGARDRIEVSQQVHTKHGLAPKRGPRPGYARHRRVVLQGGEDRKCAGVRQQPPRKGEPCDKSPLKGSEFCLAHDPGRKERRDLNLAYARASLSEGEMVPMAPLADWLQRRRGELGSWAAVAEAVGRDISLVHSYGRGLAPHDKQPKDSVGRETVERLLGADGTATFETLYGTRAVAAA